MASTYELIKKLPAKGFDWKGFNAALRTEFLSFHPEGLAYCSEMALAEWDAAKGMRATRTAAMEMASWIVDKKSKRSHFETPSQETLSWGGFLGGTHLVWNDADAEKTATQDIYTLAAKFKH